MSAAWQTATQIKRTGGVAQRAGFVFGDFQVAAKKAAEYEKEINKLNGDITRLIKGKDAESEKNKKLNEFRVFAGLTQVSGPGIVVTLLDSAHHNALANDPLSLANLIHDADIVLVVNELKAAGAEAVAVNGERIIGISSIRCVGPVVHVNNVPAAPPYIIEAVGDQNALYGGINLPNGVLDRLKQFDANMVKVERKDKLLLPAFAGGTQMRFAHEATASDETSAKAPAKPETGDKAKGKDTDASGQVKNSVGSSVGNSEETTSDIPRPKHRASNSDDTGGLENRKPSNRAESGSEKVDSKIDSKIDSKVDSKLDSKTETNTEINNQTNNQTSRDTNKESKSNTKIERQEAKRAEQKGADGQ